MKKEQIQSMIQQMTLREKIFLCMGDGSWKTKAYEHLGIPSVVMSDGTNGVRFQKGSEQSPGERPFSESLGEKFDDESAMQRTYKATCFPSGSAIACSWDRNLIGRIGRDIAKECKALGINMLLGPGMNIRRHPLTARNFEYYSEDPVLSGEMAAAIVNAIQSEGVGSCIKHFACHNSDTRRTRVNVRVSERALREIYLAGFERAVKKAAPVSLMTAYNQINGEEVSGESRVVRDILRQEWGYDGMVVCDWGAVKDPVAASRGTIDLQMPLSKGSANYLEKAVERGELDERFIDKRCQHILEFVFKLKEWESTWKKEEVSDSHALAVEAAGDSMVLLRNEDHILPLQPRKGEKYAIIGDMAKNPLYQGTGCAIVNARQVDIPLECMKKYLTDCQVTYAKGYESDGTSSETLLKEAEAAAAQADKVLLFIGNFLPPEDDDFNRKDIRLTRRMQELVERVTAVNRNCVVVLAGGEVCEMPWRHRTAALLFTWFTGEGMGEAVGEILFGKKSPSGRLSATIPERLCDTPAYLSFDGNTYDIPYGDDIYVGYRYYAKRHIEPAYPFGYGLSYVPFTYDNLVVTQNGLDVTVCVDVTNGGDMEAAEVVQLYVAPPAGELPRPVRELKAFEKVMLAPGEAKTVTLKLTGRDFAAYDPEVKDWVVEKGTYNLEIARSCQDVILQQAVEQEGTHPPRSLRYDCGFYELFQYPEAKEMFLEFLVEQKLVPQDQANEALTDKMTWSFWPVWNFLDMNSGKVPYEAYRDFIDKVNACITTKS